MSLQEELTSPLAESVAPQHSLLDEIMSRTRIQPESDGYDVARQGVVAFIRSILTSDTGDAINRLPVSEKHHCGCTVHRPLICFPVKANPLLS